MSDRTRSAYNRWSSTYDADPNPQTTLEYGAVVAAVAAAPGEWILDAACGTGRYTAAFAQAGAHVTGLDFSPPMLAIARTKVGAAAFLQADLRRPLAFRDETFDKINCAQTLKHVPSLERPIAEFARILRPEGLLVFSVTHPGMDWEGYELQSEPTFVLSDEADIHHHEWSAYEAALQGAGFQEIITADLRVSAAIARLLTPESFRRVEGRRQVLLCTALRAA